MVDPKQLQELKLRYESVEPNAQKEASKFTNFQASRTESDLVRIREYKNIAKKLFSLLGEEV
ncbi:MAG: hypothetical protein LBL91_03660 [Lachnospiraceae bacterium]|jgi:hypothetical protein|nr:hypothetical protein [Lachnospiraceae bacterium]